MGSGDGIGDALNALLSPQEAVSDNAIVCQANVALDDYLDGDLNAFEDVPMDLSLRPPFGRKVLESLREVRGGELITYGGLAAVTGSPYAARAVGGAVGSNPIMIAVPCHRVVAADGSLGGFSGGLGVKRWLLAHEGVAARPGGWENRRRPVS